MQYNYSYVLTYSMSICFKLYLKSLNIPYDSTEYYNDNILIGVPQYLNKEQINKLDLFASYLTDISKGR